MLIFLLIFVFLQCIAPTSLPVIYIIESKPVYIYNMDDPLLRSVAWIESRFQPEVINKHSGARGILQITKPMIRAVNKILVKYHLKEIQFTWKDAFDPEKSISMWYIFQTYHNPEYNVKRACKLWFGSGIQYDGKTYKWYYNQVIKRL